MQISKDFAGFTGGQSDTLRKAVGKKKIDLMRKVRTDFVGVQSNTACGSKLAEKVLESIGRICKLLL